MNENETKLKLMVLHYRKSLLACLTLTVGEGDLDAGRKALTGIDIEAEKMVKEKMAE